MAGGGGGNGPTRAAAADAGAAAGAEEIPAPTRAAAWRCDERRVSRGAARPGHRLRRVPTAEVSAHCPIGGPARSRPAAAEPRRIDDFEGSGHLDGRQRATNSFTIKEQFDATAGATFMPAPAIETTCGAAGLGAAHIRGRAADTGATFALVFSVPVAGGKAVDHYDASGTKGVSFRVALGDASASKLVSLQVNVSGSQWDYTKDVTVTGTAWQTVTLPWSDLQAAANADPFSAAKLNQIVFLFFADTDVDLYVDDIAFVK